MTALRALLLCLPLAGVAAASRTGHTVQLQYRRIGAARACPEEEYVRDAVTARLGYSPFHADAGAVITATLSGRGRALVARLEKETDAGVAARELTSASGDCAELLSALTLGLAIAIDETVLSPGGKDAGTGAAPGGYELFEDRDATYLRAGAEQGLYMGAELQVSPQGRATVMEVWGQMARVHLDDAALAAPPPRTARPVAPLRPLVGSASSSGIGDLRRVVITNNGPTAWTRCEVRLPSNARYAVPWLGPRESEGVMFFRFEQSAANDRPVPDGTVRVRCHEGESTFRLPL